MKRFRIFFGLVLLVLLASTAIVLVPGEVFGTVPKLINFQGVLRDAGGNPVANGSYSVAFRIYDAPTGGTVLWAETQSVAPNAGFFNVLLGAVNPVPDSAFKDTSRYLGITVSPDPEMTPRHQLVSVGYAYRVNSVDGALGGTISGDVNIMGKATIGFEHSNTGGNAFVAGYHNTISGGGATIGGGTANRASGYASTVSGGDTNNVSGTFGTIGGGINNIVDNFSATVGGGNANHAGYQATVGGGYGNNSSGDYSIIGGGSGNRATIAYATVSGGLRNTASGGRATVSGGNDNTASGQNAAIGGGFGNTASDANTTVGGGWINTASGFNATIGGGIANIASGERAIISGGQANTASGIYSTVPGGNLNVAAGAYSFAAGRRAKSNHSGTFVWADSTDADFASTGDNQFLIRASGGVGIGTNSPNSQLGVNGPIATAVASVSSNTTLNGSHSIVLVNTSGGGVTINLPTAVGIAGRQYTIKNINTGGGNSVFVVPNGSEKIDGANSTTLTNLSSIIIVSDGANWWIISAI